MIHKLRQRYWMIMIALMTLLPGGQPALGQGTCGTVDTIDFPIDTRDFQLAQDYGVPSPRHQGRYHTGEDWYGGRGMTAGLPVHAVAAGMVTYSAPNGWGRDGGVVIIEHTLPDGSVAYSQYGHMNEANGYIFPPRYACVQAGQIIGAVGDPRPAPHLHLEIRRTGPDVPGPGYSFSPPGELGWLQPSRFILNWQAWLNPAHRWHLDAGAALTVPPLVLGDGSAVVLDGTRLRGLTPDGRVLWRASLTGTPAGLSRYNGLPLVIFTDGTMQLYNADGSAGERWSASVAVDSPPVEAGDLLLLHSPDGTLTALAADRRTAVWQLPDVPVIARGQASGSLIGLLTATNELLSLSPDGQLLDRAQLRAPGALAAGPNGDLLAYTQGGLWRIDADGLWSLVAEETPPGGTGGALAFSDAGLIYLLSASQPDGSRTLAAYSLTGISLWQVAVDNLTGESALAVYGDTLLLVTGGGSIITARTADGSACDRLRLYGTRSARIWQNLGDDGLLRAAVGDQVFGLDWSAFTACG